MTELIAVALDGDLLARLTERELACTGVALHGDDKGVYTLHLNFGVNATPMRPPGEVAAERQYARERDERGRQVDPNDLPVIRFVKYPKPCGDCQRTVHTGDRVRWNPGAPGKPLYCNSCRPLPTNAPEPVSA